ncbi:MAG: molybdopterin-dependent oxidoreductase [Chloroflexi bacterium]|jgi:DMSO/TMAO reductase YedYZ molybdopterin-dependent catalytic subunit|nr:molybdopterin-dependent oxidoreductase [Chloroflexota bacterium]
MRHSFTIATSSFLVVALFLVATGCGTNEESEELKALKDVQITEYEGKDLSSIGAFRENSIKGPQQVDIENYVLKVTGLVVDPAEYIYDDILDDYEHYEKVVTLDCVEGWSATILWEGMLIRELIEESAPLDSANTIIFHAYDGYTTSFPIEYIMENDILMAYKMNGVTMPPERGYPFQLVAESKWGYKWIKWITEIELSDDVDYEGYWERRGYSNSGDLDERSF